MLANAFQPLPFFRTPSFDEMFEAMCLSFLAAYDVDASTERSDNAFKRAWGMQLLNWVAADANGTPGYVVAEWTNTFVGVGVSRKMLVAINGISDLSGAGVFDLSPSQYSALPGRVKQRWATNAATVEASLLAGFDINSAASRANTQITFAGWSAGAATAELLAFRFNQQYNFPAIKCFKFGSPQVGNREWYRGRASRVQRQNLLVREDPICAVPGGGTNFNLFATIASNTCNLQLDPDVLQFSEHGRNIGGYRGLQTSFPGTLVLNYLNNGLAGGGSWNSHDRRYYLAACAAFCEGNYPSLFQRILNSELPDANNMWGQWQQGFRPNLAGRVYLDDLFQLADPAPSDVVTDPQARQELREAPTPRPIVTQTTVRANSDVGTIDAGDWGNPEPIVRTLLSAEALRRRLRIRR